MMENNPYTNALLRFLDYEKRIHLCETRYLQAIEAMFHEQVQAVWDYPWIKLTVRKRRLFLDQLVQREHKRVDNNFDRWVIGSSIIWNDWDGKVRVRYRLLRELDRWHIFEFDHKVFVE